MQKKSLLLNPNINTSKIEPLKGIQVFFCIFDISMLLIT